MDWIGFLLTLLCFTLLCLIFTNHDEEKNCNILQLDVIVFPRHSFDSLLPLHCWFIIANIMIHAVLYCIFWNTTSWSRETTCVVGIVRTISHSHSCLTSRMCLSLPSWLNRWMFVYNRLHSISIPIHLWWQPRRWGWGWGRWGTI